MSPRNIDRLVDADRELTQGDQSLENLEQAIKFIESQKKDVFKEIENFLKMAEAELFDPYYSAGLPNKLKTFSVNLKPLISKSNGKKILQLKLNSELEFHIPKGTDSSIDPDDITRNSYRSISANTAMLHFCQSEIHTWAQNQWSEIYLKERTKASLKNLYDELEQVLCRISFLDANDFQDKLSKPDLIFQTNLISAKSFIQAPDRITLKEPSAVSYLLKKIRSQWMQFIFLFSFFSILGIAGRRQIMRSIMAPILNIFNRAPLFSSIILILICFVAIKFGIKVYQEELEEERSKLAHSLRGTICQHYQKLAKQHFIKGFRYEIDIRLNLEKERIDNIQSFLESYLPSKTRRRSRRL